MDFDSHGRFVIFYYLSFFYADKLNGRCVHRESVNPSDTNGYLISYMWKNILSPSIDDQEWLSVDDKHQSTGPIGCVGLISNNFVLERYEQNWIIDARIKRCTLFFVSFCFPQNKFNGFFKNPSYLYEVFHILLLTVKVNIVLVRRSPLFVVNELGNRLLPSHHQPSEWPIDEGYRSYYIYIWYSLKKNHNAGFGSILLSKTTVKPDFQFDLDEIKTSSDPSFPLRDSDPEN